MSDKLREDEQGFGGTQLPEQPVYRQSNVADNPLPNAETAYGNTQLQVPESASPNSSSRSAETQPPLRQNISHDYGQAPLSQNAGNSYGGYASKQYQSQYQYHNRYRSPYSTPYTPPKLKKRRARTFIKVLSIILAVIVPGSAIGVTFAVLDINAKNSDDSIKYNSPDEYSYYSSETSLLQSTEVPDASADPDGPQIEAASTPEESEGEATEVYSKVSPSVVGVIVYPAGTDYTITETSEGSGIIISSDGYIATNSHVVNDTKDTGVLVKLSTGEEYIGAVVGFDKRTDLAVIKIDAEDLPVAEFADSDNVVVGQDAYAIGNPGGLQFSNSLTKGTVSAVNRTISSSSAVKYIQTDAAINPGNSGGALINSYGQVIGINTSKLVAEDYEGMGFAIPSNTVISIVNNIIKNGYVKDRAYLGITASEWSTYLAKKNDTPVGIKIETISSESAFEDSNVKVADIITELDGQSVTSLSEMFDIIDEHKPGDTITVKLFRMASYSSTDEAESFSVTITLLEDTGQ